MILHDFISLWAFTVYMENSLWFEISLWSIWLKWNLHQSEFHYGQIHVNADNEVTSHWSEILPKVKSQTGSSSLRVSCKCALTLSIQLQNYKNYTTHLETSGRAINCPCHFWENLFAWAIYHPRTKYSLKGL